MPCANCGSSDALSMRDDNSTLCFSCKNSEKGDGSNVIDMSPTEKIEMIAPSAIPERLINSFTANKYNVSKRGGDLIFYYFDADGNKVATKTRTQDKQFRTSGKWQQSVLFGQSAFQSGGLAVTITEGEIDAMSAFQMMGSKYPAVSIRNGASNALKDCIASYEWLDSFDKVYVCFDNDKPGKIAAKEVANLFSGKAYIINMLEHKDANEYLMNSGANDFKAAWWRASLFAPEGIVDGSTLWEEVKNPLPSADCPYPYELLNKLTYGMRFGELTTITAGSGVGKSQIVRELVWQVMNKTDDNIGLLWLEEGVRKSAMSLMSLASNKLLHLPGHNASEEELRDAFDATLGTGRIHLYSHFGSAAIDNILGRIRFMAKGLKCKYIFLDHISILVSGQDNADERKAIDEIMTKLRTFVEETGICLIMVSHLRRPQGQGHEEGAATSLSQLRGSAAIAQLSDMVIGLERNGQAEEENERNTTHIRVLKNRFSGDTGPGGSLLYSKETGRMQEVNPLIMNELEVL